MKYILILILFEILLCYNPSAAVEYARKYCQHYNPAYGNYANSGGDCANFVSQCLIAGGQSLDGCANIRTHGIIAGVTSLKNCLVKKGWKTSETRPPSFKAGYPMAYTNLKHITMATSVNGNIITYCGHTKDVCDRTLYYKVLYFYL